MKYNIITALMVIVGLPIALLCLFIVGFYIITATPAQLIQLLVIAVVGTLVGFLFGTIFPRPY